jgi:hypothetical protein
MRTITYHSARLSWLALLCACLVMLAWAAPAMVSGDMPQLLQHGQDYPLSDPSEATTEAEDASDDPVLFVANSKTGLCPLASALQNHLLTSAAWSPTSPVRPPNNLPSI